MNDINQDPNNQAQNPSTPTEEQPKSKPKRIRKKSAAQRHKAKPNAKPDCESCPYRLKAMADNANETKTRLIDEIRKLDIPNRCKAELAILCARSRKLGIQILRFIRRHRHLGEAAILGAIIAYLLCFIPWVGGFLALIALAISIMGGVIRELREDLAALFAVEIPVCA